MNCLIISHFFKPYSNVGSKRMTALAQFLVEKGVSVIVLKANNKEYGEDIIESNEIDKITTVELEKHYSNAIQKKFRRSAQYYQIIKRMIKEKKIDCVIISCGPFNYLSIIPKLRQLMKKCTIVIDFRDILDGSQCQAGKVSFIQKLGYYSDRIVEAKAVQHSDYCLTVSDMMNRAYMDRYPRYKSKFICIRNGYDDITLDETIISEIEKESYVKTDNKIRIGIFGKYGFYDNSFFSMLADAVLESANNGYDVLVLQFGVFENTLKKEFQKRNIENRYIFVPGEGYGKDIIKLKSVDATIATNTIKEALGTKIFDYIWINKPIITINPFPDSEQVKLTNQFCNGFYCRESKEIVKAVSIISKLKHIELDSDRSKRIQYGRRSQFEKLYSLIQEC